MIRLVDLLEVRRLGLKLLACEGSELVWIRWAQPVDDLLDAARLTGGELVVTTGRWWRSPSDAERFAYALVNRGAAAVAIERPNDDRRLEELAAACERWRLPLAAIGPGTDAATVAEAAITMIVDSRGAHLLSAVHRQNELVRVLGEPGLPAMLGVIARHLGCAVSLVRLGVVVRAEGTPALSDDDVQAIVDAAAEHPGPRPIELPGRPDALGFRVDRTSSGRPVSVLVCAGLRPQAIGEARDTVEQALPFLERQCETIRRAREARRIVGSEFFRRLASGDASGDELGAWVRALGVEPRGHVTCVTARAASKGSGHLAAGLEDVADGLDVPRIVVGEEDEASVFLFAGQTGGHTDREIARSCQLLTAQLRDFDVTLGTSSVIASDIRDVVTTLHDARRVCELNLLRDAQPQPEPAQDPSLAAFLLVGDPKACEALHAMLLEPLMAYDAKHGSDLVRTLDVFLSNTGQWRSSAAALGVHVNTLRYRLARIEKFTGRDLSSMADRVDFYVALRAREANPAESEGAASRVANFG